MKRTADIVTLFIVLGLCVAIFAASYFGTETRKSVNIKQAPAGYVQGLARQAQEEPDNRSVVPLVDGIMALGLLAGLFIMLRGRIKFTYILLIAAILTVLVDLMQRFYIVSRK